MNILILSWRGPGHPNAGGAEISTHEHAKGWVKAGHSVTLFTAAFVRGIEYEVIDGVNIIRRGRQIFGVQWEAFKWYLFGDHAKFDLVVDQFHGLPFFTPLYIRIKKLAFIHEVTKNVWKLNPWSFPLSLVPAIFGPLVEPFIFKFYKKVPFMTVSESTRQDLIEWGIQKDNITIIHNGITVPSNINAKKSNKTTILFLGALSKDKGIEDTLEVFSLVQKRYSDIEFWIAGQCNPIYFLRLKEKVKNLNLKNTKFLGYVSEQSKFEYFKKATLLINTSVREGWGLVVIEAASVGTPTVAYRVPGLKDSVLDNKTGILCDPNPTSIASEIISLLNNKLLLYSLSKNSIGWSKKFTWPESVRQSLKLLEKISPP